MEDAFFGGLRLAQDHHSQPRNGDNRQFSRRRRELSGFFFSWPKFHPLYDDKRAKFPTTL